MNDDFFYKPFFGKSCRRQFCFALGEKRTVFAKKQKAANDNVEAMSDAEKISAESPLTSDMAAVLQSETSKRIDTILDFATRAKAENEKKKEVNKELSERLEANMRDLQGILDLEEKSRHHTKRLLETWVKEGHMTAEEAKKLLDLDVSDGEFQSEWTEAARRIEGAQANAHLNTVKSEAYHYEENVKKAVEQISVANETFTEAMELINLEAQRNMVIDQYSRQLGFQLKPGTTVRFRYNRPVRNSDDTFKVDERGNYINEPIYRIATIKDVFFEDTEIDEDGKKTSVPSLLPTVAIQYHDGWGDASGHEGGSVEFIDAAKLNQIADYQGMTEVIEDDQNTDDVTEELKELNKILGVEIKEGDEFEYREIQDQGIGLVGKPSKTRGINRKVQITSIFKDIDPFFDAETSQRKGMKTTYIQLSHPVVIANTPSQKMSDTLTLGEFTKWYNRLDAMKPIDLKEARDQLYEENRYRNHKYDRKDSHYPPIELKQGEVLYYDLDPPQTFVIKDIDEMTGTITFDNGSEYTPATFVAWVKRNNVEKMTAEAQANKMTDGIKGPGKDKALKDAKDQAEKDIEARKAQTTQLADDNKPAATPHVSYLRQLWNQTSFMSIGNFYAMGKEIYEFIIRTMERREKNVIGKVGHAGFSPWWGQLGAEFKSIQQQAENERVQRFMQSYEQYGYTDLYDQLRTTGDKDELKAILQSMAAKGWINWNDEVLWKAISRVGKGIDASLYVDRYDETKIAEILDTFWGDNSYLDLKHKNTSSFNAKKNSEKEVAGEFENDPSGRNMRIRMQELMAKHLKGEFVDPAQYEAYLEFAIAAGKLSFADKVYFLIMGIGAEGPENGEFPGRTLLDTSAVGRLAATGGILGKYPIIEYFAAAKLPQYDENGKPIVDKNGNQVLGQINKNNFKQFIRDYIEKDAGKSIYSISKPAEFSPGQSLADFIEREVFYEPSTRERILKASSDCSNIDHDDMHMVAPQLQENQIKQLTRSAGGQQRASAAGIKNALVGLNHFVALDMDEFMKAVESGQENKANKHLHMGVEKLLSFVRLHAILDNRFDHGNPDLTRLRTELQQFAGVDKSRLVMEHVNELNEFMRKLILEMMKEDPESFRDISRAWDIISRPQATGRDKALQQQMAEQFSIKLNKAISALTERVGQEGVYDIIKRVQTEAPGGRLVKGIGQTPKTKEEMEQVEEQLYSFDNTQEVADLKNTVEKIDKLRFRREAFGSLTPQQKAAIKNQKVERIIERIKTEPSPLISDEDRKLLEDEISALEGEVGSLDEDIGLAA